MHRRSSYVRSSRVAPATQHRLRRWLIWTLVGVLWQLPVYYYLNQQVKQVMVPAFQANTSTSSRGNQRFVVPTANVSNPQISYDDRYLAFWNRSTLEIYDLVQSRQVWRTSSPDNGRIFRYHWLPDRNALMVFESGRGVNPNAPQRQEVAIHSLEIDGSTGQIADRFASALPNSVAAGTIQQVAVSPATNLLYFSVASAQQYRLYEVDVMKKVRILSRAGEEIRDLAVSQAKGTVYFNAKDGGSWQTLAAKGYRRVQVASNPQDRVLGVWNERLYLGTVQNGNLVKIWTAADNQPSGHRPDFVSYWEGKVPWQPDSAVNQGLDGLTVHSGTLLYRVGPSGSRILVDQENNFLSMSGRYYYTWRSEANQTIVQRYS
ncbi:MAG: hypothetical protein ACYCVD_06790 [Desulfitobacteriaceae bacterium]